MGDERMPGINTLGMGDTSFFKSIHYQRFLGVSIPDFDTDCSKFKLLTQQSFMHGIVLVKCSRCLFKREWFSGKIPLKKFQIQRCETSE